jgi:hypothetical protein
MNPRPRAEQLDDAAPARSIARGVQPGTFSALLEEVFQQRSDVAANEKQLAIGQVVGRFELVREIGRGGFVKRQEEVTPKRH